MRLVTALLCAAVLFATPPARAEVSELRIAQQTSIAFLQFNVMKHQKLLEKHAAALGVPDLKVSYATFNGPDAMNDALLSGAVDIVSGGPPGLVIIWSKTFGTSREVRGIAGLARLPWLLNSRNPAVKTIRDFTSADKIVMPSVKSSSQAVLLQMASAKEWGEANYARLDPLTASMSPADATTGLLSGSAGFNAAFTVPPFQYMQLKDPAIHTVLDSRDVIGDSTASYAWTSKSFRDANPKVFRAVVNAIKEASDFIMANKREAALYFVADTKAKVDPEEVIGIVSNPGISYNATPFAAAKWEAFMRQVGRHKTVAKSWKDMFFEDIHDLPGS
ncbi:MAG: ABC transporter substrate-binding protein [Acetobacteraceae bacterium]